MLEVKLPLGLLDRSIIILFLPALVVFYKNSILTYYRVAGLTKKVVIASTLTS
jgi:hypothetical protein